MNRICHVAQLYADYKKSNAETESKNRISRTVFYSIAHQLTSKELRRQSVYEFSNQHGFHNFRRIKAAVISICDLQEVPGNGNMADRLAKTEALEAFLRQEYKVHVRSSDDPQPDQMWVIDDNGKYIKQKIQSEKLPICNTISRLFSLKFAPKSEVTDSIGF